MSELAEFLLARLDEDERSVRSGWHREGATDQRWWGTPLQPSRILAEVEGKRRVVKRYRWYACSVNGDREAGYLEGLAFALRHLVQPYAAHPDFRKEWVL